MPFVRFRTRQSKEKHKSIGDLATICKIGMDIWGSLQACGRLATIGLASVVIVSCGGSNPPRNPAYPPIHSEFYRVHPGDTLYAISRRSGYGYRTIARWNHIKPPYTIKVNQILRLTPPPVKQSHIKGSRAPNRHAISSHKKKSKKILKIIWRWPLKGVIVRNFIQTGKKGIDIAAIKDRYVRAAAAGKVVYSGSGLVGYGNLIIIKHGEIYLSAYGNNRRLLVEEGQKVKAGQIISELGSRATNRPILHFEIRRQGDPVNPLRFLPRR